MAKDENSKFKNSTLQKLDLQLGGLLSEATSEEDFTGKAGQSTIFRLPGLGSKRVGLYGLGTASANVAYRNLGEAVAFAAKSAKANNVAITLASSEAIPAESKSTTASSIATGAILGTFDDMRFKSESKKPVLKSVDIIGLGSGVEIEKKLKFAVDVCSGIIFGKELVNAPANVLTPGVLAEEATKIASEYSDVFTAKILDIEQCKELKMGSYLGVAAASANPPHFIHLCYKPSRAGCMIELMKFDMGGSAVVLGAAKALGQIKPAGVEVHFIVAACENMISGTGMRPGDILTASNGKTIEVGFVIFSSFSLYFGKRLSVPLLERIYNVFACFQILGGDYRPYRALHHAHFSISVIFLGSVNNTDAEGRLTLADALVYACNQGVEKIVDLATLTGACIVALGPSVAGVFTPSDDLSKEVFEASEISGEKLWRMPMEESYWETMKSGVADMVNTGGRQGGAITAALFLKQVHFIVAACENMISGTGMRPGDILTASNGKTIEVNNTDAEGRLTLADALVYACNQDSGSGGRLTGACIVALGPSVAGVFTPSDDLSKEVFEASEISGEKLWRMPMEESYWETMKSGVADMVNTGGRQGGAITAALFLKQFVDEKVQWMHIDIAGPVWNDKKKNATGFGISTMVEWVLKNSS
ncbi:leucine aminopeptidase 3 chloroplastic [Phtheirospermum japonicum]|uniref:Leucine aminopeptidase 3 chloroplastic n=1 Tax=Phtheirospermum japonicum TaxID=374723 RepID=A0A830C4Z6_9LAMI|nr:leucine aminopeptidase 3 chloroplastic [Phtheirospermum japonicum]